MRKSLLATLALGLALLAGPAAAMPGQPGPFGSAAPQPQQGGTFTLEQFVVGTWLIDTEAGRNVATYFPDGSVAGTVYLRNRPQPVPFEGSWSVRPLGGDRVELIVSVGRQSARETLRLLAYDSIYNESARAMAYRVY
jgi:hypothetical protein